MDTISDPTTHYFKPPYPLLSFLFALYCDDDWSEREYKKWILSGKTYEGYTNPHKEIVGVPRDLITVQVGKNPTLPGEHRRNPTTDQAELFWPHFLEELSLAPQTILPIDDGTTRKEPYYFEHRPVISALACIYLGGVTSTDWFLPVKRQELAPMLARVIQARTSGKGLKTALEALKPMIIEEFTKTPFTW